LRSALAELLEIHGRIDEAVAEHREAVAAEPNSLFTLRRMCHSLIRFGRPREARVTWGQSLETNPSDHDRWYGYAEFCLYLGDEAEYHRARTALLGKFGQTTAPHIAERTARAALLAPANGSELERAAALAMFVASLDRQKLLWEYPFYQFVRGLAEYRQGKFGQAISTLRGDARHRPGPTPQLVPAMALQRDGQDAEARKTLAAALLNYDWRTDEIHDQDGWITHVLRREAEMLIIGR
jgi:serine/threonine-protein kinase